MIITWTGEHSQAVAFGLHISDRARVCGVADRDEKVAMLRSLENKDREEAFDWVKKLSVFAIVFRAFDTGDGEVAIPPHFFFRLAAVSR
jgi:hypothetical protein